MIEIIHRRKPSWLGLALQKKKMFIRKYYTKKDWRKYKEEEGKGFECSKILKGNWRISKWKKMHNINNKCVESPAETCLKIAQTGLVKVNYATTKHYFPFKSYDLPERDYWTHFSCWHRHKTQGRTMCKRFMIILNRKKLYQIARVWSDCLWVRI